jgi:hypothetical protein
VPWVIETFPWCHRAMEVRVLGMVRLKFAGNRGAEGRHTTLQSIATWSPRGRYVTSRANRKTRPTRPSSVFSTTLHVLLSDALHCTTLYQLLNYILHNVVSSHHFPSSRRPSGTPTLFVNRVSCPRTPSHHATLSPHPSSAPVPYCISLLHVTFPCCLS